MVTGEDQVMLRTVCLDDCQSQQGCRLQVEATPTIGLGPGIQPPLDVLLRGPVQHVERQLDVFADHLHRAFKVGDECGAQHVVSVQHCLPGTLEPLDIQARNVDAHLIDILALALLEDRVKQHALLHGRKRIDVLDGTCRNRQGIQLGLIQRSQRDIGRCQGDYVLIDAMVDQRLKFADIVVGQGLYRGAVEHVLAERPGQAQLASVDLPVDGQQVFQQGLGRLASPAALAGRLQESLRGCAWAFGKGAVKLPQVIERDGGHWQASQHIPCVRIPQITQRAITDALVGDRAELFLDLLDRGIEGRRRCQLHREQAGQPADSTGQVDRIEQVFTAMPFQLHQHLIALRPTGDHTGQGGQQQVVDLGAVGGWSLL